MESHQRATRFHALDGVRAFAMLLGVFLHASVPYIHVKFPWAVVDDSRSVSLTLLIYVIHAFRMPAFFLIAGFFARLVFQRAGLGSFVGHRTQRILLPLVVGWLVLHPLMRALWVWSGIRAMPGSSYHDLLAALSTVFAPEFITRGLGLMHLWFLYYLLLLYIAFLCARAAFVRLDRRRRIRRDFDRYFVRLAASVAAPFALSVPTTWVLMMMKGWGVDFVARSLIPNPAHILFYGAFFVFGWMLHRNPSSIGSLRDRWLVHLCVAVVLLVPLGWQLYLIHTVHYPAGPWFRLAYFLLYGTLTWSLILALIGAFQRFFNRPTGWWRYLADASYWTYLAHLPLVVCLSILLREAPWPWFVKLPVVLMAAVPILLGSYHLLVRGTWIGLMLNGRRLPLRKFTP